MSGCELGFDTESLRKVYGMEPPGQAKSAPAASTTVNASYQAPRLPAPLPSPSASPGFVGAFPSITPVRGEPETGEWIAVGDRCHSADHDAICLGLRFVVYRDEEGTSLAGEHEVADTVRAANLVWRECGISFEVDEFRAVRPERYSLKYRTANYSELAQIRRAFQTPSQLLVVVTGPWDRHGTLGNTGANAWTNLPGESLYGSVLEKSVGTTGNVLAHELGHYLSLDHVRDPADVMNPVIYPYSRELDRAQCKAAKWAAFHYWLKMMR